MDKKVRYPIGEQSFEALRRGGFFYVDKTRFIDTLVNEGGKYYFLGRPRRFGKSLFLSTLKCFFQGKRHLFKGLYADSMEWDWESYPVLHLDLNIEQYQTPETLDQVINNSLLEWEAQYDVKVCEDNISVRFRNIIRRAYEKTGKEVVILVDEYDKPLVHNLHNKERFDFFREKLSAIYSNFKSGADYIRLVMLTGVSRFGHLSIFSSLNNIHDISFSNLFNDICGISEKELHRYFEDGLSRLSEVHGLTRDELLKKLKKRYDGYRFSSRGEDIYNPFSLLLVMDSEEFGNYWIRTGQPTLLLEQLKRFRVDLKELMNVRCLLTEMQGLDLDNPRPVALLYQTGYLTIKDFNPRRELYTLGLPNNEVMEGFYSYLLPHYANLGNDGPMPFVYDLIDEFEAGDVEGFMSRISRMFSSVSYDMHMEREENIHNALLILMKLMSLEVETEYRTSNGRIDLFVRTRRYYYIIEIKLDGTAKEALDQINGKGYALPFEASGREVVKIGVNFSSTSRTFSEWLRE